MIQVEGLTKRYGTTTAIDGVSFEVAKGEVVGFLGPNGAGKTTTMRILTGSLGATAGVARIGGQDVSTHAAAVKRKVGYLPEVPPLYVTMTVRDYVAYAGRLKGVKDAAAVDRALERVGLTDVGHRIIDHLSKGYRQRVGLAQAIVHDPEVLILDEPASGLDPAQRVEIRALLKQLAAGEATIILSTHVLAEVEALCDRVVIIDRGRVVATDTLEDLARQQHHVALQVRDVGAALEAIRAVDGVELVEDQGHGRLLVRCATDLRAEVAVAAAPHGLLALGARKGLEDIYLSLTQGNA